MSRAVPTLYVGPDSDVARFIESSGGGTCVASGAVDAFADVVERWAAREADLHSAGKAAAEYYLTHLSKERGLAAYRAAVVKAAESRPAGTAL
jgi:hypothetical protein